MLLSQSGPEMEKACKIALAKMLKIVQNEQKCLKIAQKRPKRTLKNRVKTTKINTAVKTIKWGKAAAATFVHLWTEDCLS